MTKPNQEAIAADNLARQGFSSYYPRFLEKAPKKAPTIKCLFPRYIFILYEGAWRAVTGTRGISHTLIGRDGPLTVQPSVIDELKRREGSNGLISLEKPPKFTSGSKVKALDGHLTGHLMIYEGMSTKERCWVLVSMLGGQVRTELPEKSLIAA